MSILLLGARFPKNGSPLDCTIRKDGRSIISYETGTGIMRYEDFTAIELPPHGRLIDADALIDAGWQLSRDNIFTGKFEVALLSSTPTIIESEHVRCG